MRTLIRDARFVDVNISSIYRADVLIEDDRVVSVRNQIGESPDFEKIINANGRYLIPGLIDSHVHIESSMLTPNNLAEVLLTKGTTAIVADPHEITSVLGVNGLKYFIDEARRCPVKIYFTAPYKIVKKLADDEGLGGYRDQLIGLGEVSPFFFSSRDEFIQACDFAKANDLLLEGHLGPDYAQKHLDFATFHGVSSCHETVSADEAFEKMRRGVTLIVREGSAAKNLDTIFDHFWVRVRDPRKLLFCTDDLEIDDLLFYGDVDNCLRKAVRKGVDPIKAIQMATVNAASHFRLDGGYGSVAPGKYADLVLLHDIFDFEISLVMVGGREVYSDGSLNVEFERNRAPDFCNKSFILDQEIGTGDFRIEPATRSRFVDVRVIGVINGQIYTTQINARMKVTDGQLKADLSSDFLKIAVIDRYNEKLDRIPVGFVHGFGLKGGALATSIAHDEHNIIVVGTNDDDMAFAANEILKRSGGLVSVLGGKILGEVILPVAGLMSDKSSKDLYKQVVKLQRSTRELKCVLKSPFMTMSFLSLPIPELKIDKRGLLHVMSNQYVTLFS
ncbi:MAG: amidohydrolase family protein [Actinobacteria bacterium]|nr:amidohydrolase family protein [Actinomycetota bacterium]